MADVTARTRAANVGYWRGGPGGGSASGYTPPSAPTMPTEVKPESIPDISPGAVGKLSPYKEWIYSPQTGWIPFGKTSEQQRSAVSQITGVTYQASIPGVTQVGSEYFKTSELQAAAKKEFGTTALSPIQIQKLRETGQLRPISQIEASAGFATKLEQAGQQGIFPTMPVIVKTKPDTKKGTSGQIISFIPEEVPKESYGVMRAIEKEKYTSKDYFQPILSESLLFSLARKEISKYAQPQEYEYGKKVTGTELTKRKLLATGAGVASLFVGYETTETLTLADIKRQEQRETEKGAEKYFNELKFQVGKIGGSVGETLREKPEFSAGVITGLILPETLASPLKYKVPSVTKPEVSTLIKTGTLTTAKDMPRQSVSDILSVVKYNVENRKYVDIFRGGTYAEKVGRAESGADASTSNWFATRLKPVKKVLPAEISANELFEMAGKMEVAKKEGTIVGRLPFVSKKLPVPAALEKAEIEMGVAFGRAVPEKTFYWTRKGIKEVASKMPTSDISAIYLSQPQMKVKYLTGEEFQSFIKVGRAVSKETGKKAEPVYSLISSNEVIKIVPDELFPMQPKRIKITEPFEPSGLVQNYLPEGRIAGIKTAKEPAKVVLPPALPKAPEPFTAEELRIAALQKAQAPPKPVKFYHGTQEENIPKILKEGLFPGRTKSPNTLEGMEAKKYTFLTSSREMAKFYAEQGKGKGGVIEVLLSPEQAARAEPKFIPGYWKKRYGTTLQVLQVKEPILPKQINIFEVQKEAAINVQKQAQKIEKEVTDFLGGKQVESVALRKSTQRQSQFARTMERGFERQAKNIEMADLFLGTATTAREVQRNVFKDTSRLLEGTAAREATRQTPLEISRLIGGQVSKETQRETSAQRTRTATATRLTTPGQLVEPPAPPPLTPFFFPPSIPQPDIAELFGQRPFKKPKQPQKYTPDIQSILLNIKGKPPKLVTGLEIRPIPEKQKIKQSKFMKIFGR